MTFCFHPIRYILKAHEKRVKMNDMLTDPSFVPPSSCDASRCVSYSAGWGEYPAPKAVQDLAGQGTPSHPLRARPSPCPHPTPCEHPPTAH